jgi:23S rRNA pseudouridine1911/1915/1917 synthase
MAQTLEIIYRDHNVAAVNKPANLASIPGRGETTSVIEQLASQLGLPCAGDTDPRIRVVHRLDKDTSGVLLFALNIEAQRLLSQQFQNNLAQKQYLALVIGGPQSETGEIDAPIAPDRKHVGLMMIHKRGKPARTEYRVEEMFRGLTLLRVFPKTGKTHQIRVHLRHIGHPLAVDPLYGPPAEEGLALGLYLSKYKRGYRLGKWVNERPLLSRLSLHAERLEAELPGVGRKELVAELPKDFRATLNMLRKYARG